MKMKVNMIIYVIDVGTSLSSVKGRKFFFLLTICGNRTLKTEK